MAEQINVGQSTPSDSSDQEKLAISPFLVAPAALAVTILLMLSFTSKMTFASDPRLVLGYAAFCIAFACSHFLPFSQFGKAHAFYLYTYHWLTSFMLIFIVPTLSFYLYLWVMLMYLAEFFYQAKGMVLSAVSLLVVMISGTLYQENGLNRTSMARILMEFGIIVCVNLVMTRIAFGNRRERADMQQKVLRAEFEHSRLISLINSMSDGVIATDEAGKILNYNAAALDLLNTNATLTDEYLGNYLKPLDPQDHQVDIMQIARTTNYLQRRSDLSVRYGEDDKVSLDINISRITSSTMLARQQGYTFLLRDITLQKSLDEERDLFISEVSHELRTPLTIAEGEMSNAMLLVEKPTAVDIPKIKGSIEKSHDQIMFLSDMVNDLSALSRAQRDDKDMDVETFSMADVLHELEETYRPRAEKKGLKLIIELAPSIPQLTTSRLYFKEILQNFVTNAIKYTDKGSVTIKGQAVDREHVIVGVTDTGAGIAKSEQAKVYQKFWRSEDPLTRSTGGTGLGLFITAKLAHRLGAELRLESQLKVGSTFAIVVPTKAVKPVDHAKVAQNEVATLFS